MPTLMTRATFDELAKIRDTLGAGPLAPVAENERLAGILVPWAGPRLKTEGGIYYVGMATAGLYMGDDDPPTFDAQLQLAESLCVNNRNLEHSPFWQFLDGLSWALLGAPFNETSDSWGWSNLFKIGWSSINNPSNWRQPLIGDQRDVCIAALNEEFVQLHDSLIIIASGERFGLIEKYEDKWNKDYEETGVWSFTDANSHNLYVTCYHPRYLVSGGRVWGSALGYTIHLARTMPRFA